MTAPTTDDLTLLAQIPLFHSVDRDEITAIGLSTRRQSLAKGDFLFHKGDDCQGFHLLLSGQIKLAFISSQGNEKVVEIISAGQTFGEAIMFLETPYIVTAQALADSQLLHVGKAALFTALDHQPRLARKLLAGLAIRLHQRMNDLEAYTLQSGRQRIISYFLRELAAHPSATEPPDITLATTKGLVASRLNLTQEHFSRILNELANDGLIRVDSRRIQLLDLDTLQSELP
ncbi:MAG: Crp/Fnr family transcriptional regulator [Dechloromonas sp.]|nr:Crp/Fnr family transcriptional regulator [Dechloromonas sp.]